MHVAPVKLRNNHSTVHCNTATKGGGFRIMHVFSWTAYDITLADDNWPKDIFDVVKGNTSQSWDRLDAGDCPT
ncbi:hypothetical protein OIU77_001979, partial [Salix suchowensis]